MTITVLSPLGDAADGASARIRVSGEIDASNAERLRAAIFDVATKQRARLDVDLAEVTFMDSTGLRAIAEANLALEPFGSWLVLCNVGRQVRRLLEITDIGQALKVGL